MCAHTDTQTRIQMQQPCMLLVRLPCLGMVRDSRMFVYNKLCMLGLHIDRLHFSVIFFCSLRAPRLDVTFSSGCYSIRFNSLVCQSTTFDPASKVCFLPTAHKRCMSYSIPMGKLPVGCRSHPLRFGPPSRPAPIEPNDAAQKMHRIHYTNYCIKVNQIKSEHGLLM